MSEKVRNWWESQNPERQRYLMLGGLGVVLLILIVLVWLNTPSIQVSGDRQAAPDRVDPHLWGGGESNIQAIEDLARTVDSIERQFGQMQESVERSIQRMESTREDFLDWTRDTGIERQVIQAQRRYERLEEKLDELESEAEEAEISAAGVTPFQPGRETAQPEPRETPQRPEPETPRPQPRADQEEEDDEVLQQDLFAGTGVTPRQQDQPRPDRPEPRREPQPEPQRTGLVINGRSLAAIAQEEAEREQERAESMEAAQEQATDAGRREARRPERDRDSVNDQIPVGSILSGVMLHGVDAPTGSGARGQPVPLLIRITDLSILPNHFTADMVDCHAIGAGFGSLSEERLMVRLEDLACVDEDGGIVHSPISGYVVGPDGKVGVRGPVVQRNGALIARSMQAGVLSGFGQAFGGRRRGITIGTGQRVTDSPGVVAEEGLSRGVGTAMQQVAEHYLDMADAIYAVVSVEPETPVEIVLNQPLEVGR